MNTQDAAQVYEGETAEGYKGFGDCDANVYGWAKKRLNGGTIGGKTVLDAGCGKGSMFEHFESAGAARVLGVEASEEMIRGIPHAPRQALIKWPADPEFVQAVLAHSRRLIILGALQDVLPEAKIQADVAVNIFNVVCFPHPRIPITSMTPAVAPGGKLLIVSNTFVPSHLGIGQRGPDEAVDIDLHDRSLHSESLQPGEVFRQILHLRSDDGKLFDLPLQDHAHTLGDFSSSFGAQWDIETAKLFPPQGCTLVDPWNPGAFEHAHAHFPKGHPVFSPLLNKRMQYAKLCLIAHKRA